MERKNSRVLRGKQHGVNVELESNDSTNSILFLLAIIWLYVSFAGDRIIKRKGHTSRRVARTAMKNAYRISIVSSKVKELYGVEVQTGG